MMGISCTYFSDMRMVLSACRRKGFDGDYEEWAAFDRLWNNLMAACPPEGASTGIMMTNRKTSVCETDKGTENG